MRHFLLRISFLLAGAVLVSAILHAETTTHLRLATTTSTENSGLLTYLLPMFEKETGIKVDVIVVGTGKALKLGEYGDVDVVLVHARAAEEAFVAAGFGVDRQDVMYNDFVVAGPTNDPAGLKELRSARDVFVVLGRGAFPFVSRGDDSGTHEKEKELWKSAGVEPSGEWYLETGQGMDASLRIADEKGAYCLVDRGTYIAFNDKIQLNICFEGDEVLFNPYGIIAVNPKRHAHVKYKEAVKLIEWITTPKAQKAIYGFLKDGERLFCPARWNPPPKAQ